MEMEKDSLTGENDTKAGRPERGQQHTVERVFERSLWSTRYFVLLGVICSALSALVLFIAGSLEVLQVLVEYVGVGEHHLTHERILIGIIGAVDFYLIALVLLIISFGIYELFISEIDVARHENRFGGVLDIESLDDLKNKIIKVIIMVLIVNLFQRVLSMEFSTSLDMLAMALSIGVICVGVYFLGRHGE